MKARPILFRIVMGGGLFCFACQTLQHKQIAPCTGRTHTTEKLNAVCSFNWFWNLLWCLHPIHFMMALILPGVAISVCV